MLRIQSKQEGSQKDSYRFGGASRSCKLYVAEGFTKVESSVQSRGVRRWPVPSMMLYLLAALSPSLVLRELNNLFGRILFSTGRSSIPQETIIDKDGSTCVQMTRGVSNSVSSRFERTPKAVVIRTHDPPIELTRISWSCCKMALDLHCTDTKQTIQ